MPFNIDYLGKVSTTANNQAKKVWSYNGTADGSNEAIATIVASAYFNSLQQRLTSGSEAGPLSVGDVFHIHGNDANGMYVVDGITTNVTVATYAAIGAIGTAQLEDGAVTNVKVNTTAAIAYSKLAALADANILVGSGANVATVRAVTGDVTISNTGVTTIGAGAVDSAMVNANLLRYAAVPITAAQFNGAYVAPFVLVAAAGANTLITLHRAELLMTYATTQFADGGAVHIQYDSTANGAGILASTTQAAADFFDAVSTANALDGGAVKNPFSTCVDKGLYLSNVTGAFTTGDSDLVAHVWYSVVPTV